MKTSVALVLAALLTSLNDICPAGTATGVPVSGYASTVSGATISYPSPISPARSALISRATDGTSSIVWKTMPAPDKVPTFIWLAGFGCNLGESRFTLSVNGKETASFTTAPKDAWEVTGTGGARLQFTCVLVDRNKDRFGLMQLTLPDGMYEPGKPVELRITGEAAKSSAWVMTYTYPITNGLTVASRPILLRKNGKVVQPLDLEILNLGATTTGTIHIAGLPDETVTVPFGVTRYPVNIVPVSKPARMTIELALGETAMSANVTVNPVRRWTLYLVQHAHTDIGYTRPQTEILGEHLRYIDLALDLCDQTDLYPDDAKFRWTCETSWAVREYMKIRPASQIARLKKRIEEGRIEVTGMLLNWAEVADENALVHSLEPISAMKTLGLPVRTAMQDDVNGYAWGLVDYFQDLGIRYVTSGINAARALKPFNVPTPFWWESPSGKRVLAYRADHYMTGNFQNIHTTDFDLIQQELPGYLQQLEMDGYPYDRVSMQYSGYFTDNSPPSTFSSDNIRKWNEVYESPKLRSATVREFLEWVEKEHGPALPVFRVAWPDWWTDGFGCAMRETAANRLTAADLIANQGLLAMAQRFGATLPPALQEQVRTVADNLHFYNEHTFGAAESITDPMADNTQTQWAEKSSYAWQGVMQSRLLREGAMGQLQPFLLPSPEPSIVVFNTLNWERSGLHVVYIDNQILPKDRVFRLMDERGGEIFAQILESRPEGNYWALWVKDIPPLGYRTYRIVVSKEDRPADPAFSPRDTLDNAFYKVAFDQKTGGVTSIVDRELGQEILDHGSAWQFGQLIYERLSDRHSMEELRLGGHTRTAMHNVSITAGIDGPIWQSLIVKGVSNGFVDSTRVTCEIRFYKNAKRIELIYKGRKETVNDPEAAYVAFPFAMKDGKLVYEAQGGLAYPGENQLPGTTTDWNTSQNFAALRSPQGQIVLVSEEIPLMQFGGINTGRFQKDAKPASGQIYSWVLNNYWTTNFRSAQEGEMTWRYAITSGKDASNDLATRFGWGTRIPFVSRVLPAHAEKRNGTTVRSAWPFVPAPVLLVSVRPADEGVILHLRETGGKPVTLTVAAEWKDLKMEETDALGTHLRTVTSVSFKPYEVKFVRLLR
jgi:alpha-mannosidase